MKKPVLILVVQLATALAMAPSSLLAEDRPVAPPVPAVSEKRLHELPLTTAGNMLYLPVKFDGVELDLLMDTGAAPDFVLSRKQMEEMGKELTEKGTSRGVAGSTAVMEARFDLVEVGTALKVKNARAMVTSFPAAPVRAGSPNPFGGLMGSNLFNATKCSISYAEKKLFTPVDNESNQLRRTACLAQGGWTADFLPGPSQLPCIKVMIGGKPYSFVLDTAAETNVMINTVAAALGLVGKPVDVKIVGAGGDFKGAEAVVAKEVDFGNGLQLPSAEFMSMPDHARPTLPEGAPTYGGIIGAAFFTVLKAELDYASQTLLAPELNTPDKTQKTIAALSALQVTPGRTKAVALSGLTKNSTEEDVRKALLAAGMEATEDQVKGVMAQLSPTPAKDQKAPAKTGKKLPFKVNSTEAEVRKILEEAGVPATDERVQEIMKQLKAAQGK